ncbi:DUF1804 family protein [Jeongeupia chitinilytica]|uniref:DNA-binding protein n=1 Tax=Jeongeupia chitinilytica TaxID=1041641 RepID=A0ABQ3H068_9NEIS|nr:DUF1804 family protein [Jeongeupia chitinilytica]GHD63815.1 DNA-binding protein [Jeongeupia chitinilytica]
MAHPKETREQVRRAYIFDQMALELAALKFNVPTATARRWKRDADDEGDDWDKLRAAQTLAGGSMEDLARQMLAGFLLQYQAAMEALNTDDPKNPLSAVKRVEMLASLADSYNKTVAASKRVLPETSELATAMSVVQMLGGFIRDRYPKHAQAFVEVLEPFGAELAKSFG